MSAPRNNKNRKDQSGATPHRTVGPVADLEHHLPPDWWRNLFGALYLQTDGDVVENERNTRREVVTLIRAAGLDPAKRVLDLCCGQGRHSLELARQGYTQVIGVDRSRYLIRLARKRASSEGLGVRFREGDARNSRIPANSFDCVAIMGNSFGYFEKEEQDIQVLKEALRLLCSHGTIFLDIVDGAWLHDHFEARSWEWADQNHLICRERSLSKDGRRLISREVIIQAERGVIADQFYGERLYTREALRKLLLSAGFRGVIFHEDIEAESTRGQDLGMMAHRMVVTASAPEKAKARVRPGPLFPQVTVVMGDPSLPDPVKREGRFNPEDLNTIERLRTALEGLKGFHFRYLSHHQTLLNTLQTTPPQFVLNLCDEGYANDPRLELHVPAVLEMLRIPYSGCGPASLAMCYNKSLVRALAQALDIPVPEETYFGAADSVATVPSVFPVLLKPNFGDSSIGITVDSVIEDPGLFVPRLEQLRQSLPGVPILVQEFLQGTEYSVGIIGNIEGDLEFLPVIEADYSDLPAGLPPILGYESKWYPESPYWTKIHFHEAHVNEHVRALLQDYSLRLFNRLECRDYARFDFRADSSGQIKLLEVNPNPGWCWDGKFAYMAGFAGMSYGQMLQKVLEAAQGRYEKVRGG
jgi:D-alanine-D-alanine ligase